MTAVPGGGWQKERKMETEDQAAAPSNQPRPDAGSAGWGGPRSNAGRRRRERDEQNYSTWGIADLKEECKRRRVRGYSTKTKPDLVRTLQEYDSDDLTGR